MQQRLVAVGLLAQGDAGRASLGHVGQDEADADRLAVAAHGPVRGDPVALGPADLDLAERRPRAHDPRRVLPHRGRQVGQKLLERVAARAGDLGEPVVDAQEPQIAVEQRDADGSVREHDVEQADRLAELRVGALQPGAQDGDPDGQRRARRHGDDADDVLPLEVTVLEQPDEPERRRHEADRGGRARTGGERDDQRPEHVARDEDGVVPGDRVEHEERRHDEPRRRWRGLAGARPASITPRVRRPRERAPR